MKTDKDLLVMKLIHYFITNKNYKPVLVHGINNEVWLENMDSNIKIIRIVTNYIHNSEQLNFDEYKLNKLVRQIKIKTFTLNLKTMSFYIDINEDLKLENTNNNLKINALDEKTIFSNDDVLKYFNDIKNDFKYTEDDNLIYQKINNDILKKNLSDTEKINDLFTPKKPIVTNILMVIMSIIFALMYLLGSGSLNIKTLINFGALINDGNIIRVISSIFLHIGIIHFLCNMYSLRLIGSKVESFYGHFKYLIIFIYSGIIGNLLSLVLLGNNNVSAGASGSIFGLMGALLYFALNQRTYMQDALRREIIPIIILNLFISFTPGINLYAHVGGLIGGIIISTALGIKYKSSKVEKVNGTIVSIVLFAILFYMSFIK